MNEYTMLYKKEYMKEHCTKQNCWLKKDHQILLITAQKKNNAHLNKREGIKGEQDKGSCEQILSAFVV